MRTIRMQLLGAALATVGLIGLLGLGTGCSPRLAHAAFNTAIIAAGLVFGFTACSKSGDHDHDEHGEHSEADHEGHGDGNDDHDGASHDEHGEAVKSREMYFSTYQAIAEGTRFLLFYNYRPTSWAAWSGLGQIAREVRDLRPALIAEHANVAVTTAEGEDIVIASLHRTGDRVWVIAVNRGTEPSCSETHPG